MSQVSECQLARVNSPASNMFQDLDWILAQCDQLQHSQQLEPSIRSAKVRRGLASVWLTS